jgi:hypothetical protein
MPGAVTSPSLPAAVTTVMPSAQSRSTASVSGAVAGSDAGAPSDRFSTLMSNRSLDQAASWSPYNTCPRVVPPSRPATLRSTRSAPGATPEGPERPPSPAISPAMKVPWP